MILSKSKMSVISAKPKCYYSSIAYNYDLSDLRGKSREQLQCLCYIRKDILTKENLRILGQEMTLCEELDAIESNLGLLKTLETIILPIITILFDLVYKGKRIQITYSEEVMANYEVHKDNNHHSLSIIIKMFLWRYYTLGICPILSDISYSFAGIEYAKYPRTPGILGEVKLGFYDDFTSIWYKMKGTGVVRTCFMRILILFFQGLFKYLIPRLKTAHDQR